MIQPLLVAIACVGIIGSPSFATKPIVGTGAEAKQSVAPYVVSVQIIGYHSCGGSIIGDRWILTAKSCVVSLGPVPCCITVLVGSNDYQQGGTMYDVDRVLPYANVNTTADIALVRLATPLKFNSKVAKIQYSKVFVPDNANLTLTGWVADETENGLLTEATTLQAFDVRHIARERCIGFFNYSKPIGKAFMCTTALEKGHGACNDNSGVPVIWKGQQVAVASNVITDDQYCDSGLPLLHTRISAFYDWIQKTIADNSD